MITVKIEKRPGSGLRITSIDVPGLVLSGSDPAAVLNDLVPALQVLRPDLFERR